MGVVNANAVPMCAQTTTTATVLDPNIAGLSYDYNNTLGLWTVSFPYGTINGISACLTSAYGKSLGGTVSQLEDDGDRVVGGESGLAKDGETEKKYCWCSATAYTPSAGNQCQLSSSLWVFRIEHGSSADCADFCANGCGKGVAFESAFRVALFGAAQ